MALMGADFLGKSVALRQKPAKNACHHADAPL
jgi:hypothetical protein